ncbi:amino acid ABC transporter permease [Deinococcus maricopensis]|uniref:Polar amino acid ABC transporter, inner membrane subunit n=1 Tax=Deinococcus maricopensis (strain DSM 21211 / LMG 22137 / NRRL B-23946 / LB-34) TaxID=709986 RepID=E8U913_DEIML|nr:amino acid ABC transporter permease [Deinococcus maricopensis]ADV67552.1 polar amino acid ABC transporter, inner membrane subunit [Deinococcus maricopensis DSM 21211]
MSALSYLIPGLGQLLTGAGLLGAQYLLAALILWPTALGALRGPHPEAKLLAVLTLLALHVGAGLTAQAGARGRRSADAAAHAQDTYRRWSTLIAAAFAVLLLDLLGRWIIALPSWDQVHRNFLFFLIGRFRSADYADERWRLWGFAAIAAGGALTWLLARAHVRAAWLPALLGLLAGGVVLLPTVTPEVRIGGLALSLILAVLGLLLSLPFGLFFGIGRVSALPLLRAVSTVYIELFRGLPFITVIFWFFIFVPYVLGEGTQFWAVILALALFTGAYVAEIVRAGIRALPRGQDEAARALGLSGTHTMLSVILPQALRNMIPPLVGQFISLFKDTSLVSIIGLIELAGAARITGNRVVTATFEIYLTVAVLYFIFAYALSSAARRLEAPTGRRVARATNPENTI